jgi:hypothetical protein
MLFEQQLSRIEHKVDRIMAAQDDINAAVAALGSFLTDLSGGVTAIQNELAAAPAAVDTSALNTIIGQLPAAQAALDALANPAAATPPPPASSSAAANPVS